MCSREAHAHSLHKTLYHKQEICLQTYDGNVRTVPVGRLVESLAGWSACRVNWVPDHPYQHVWSCSIGRYLPTTFTYIHVCTHATCDIHAYACIPMIYTQTATCGKIAHTNVTSDRVKKWSCKLPTPPLCDFRGHRRYRFWCRSLPDRLCWHCSV